MADVLWMLFIGFVLVLAFIGAVISAILIAEALWYSGVETGVQDEWYDDLWLEGEWYDDQWFEGEEDEEDD